MFFLLSFALDQDTQTYTYTNKLIYFHKLGIYTLDAFPFHLSSYFTLKRICMLVVAFLQKDFFELSLNMNSEPSLLATTKESLSFWFYFIFRILCSHFILWMINFHLEVFFALHMKIFAFSLFKLYIASVFFRLWSCMQWIKNIFFTKLSILSLFPSLSLPLLFFCFEFLFIISNILHMIV